MPVSRAMRRLLDVLQIQEEEYRAAMDSARAEFEQLQKALAHGRERERTGRALITVSATTGEIADRVAGVEETRVARCIAAALAPRIAEAAEAVKARRREFLGKRIERRQTETVIEGAEAKDKAETGRREQRNLDDWFLGRRRVK
jgi:flagellar biosynthesis chaperone FliJ